MNTTTDPTTADPTAPETTTPETSPAADPATAARSGARRPRTAPPSTIAAAGWATVVLTTGPFTVVAADGVVLASGWVEDPQYLADLVHPTIRPAELHPVDHLGPITDAARRYDDGDLAAIDGIEVRQRSGPFIENAWAELRRVRPGAQVTYREFAERSGNRDAHRAAAAACARNAAALFVPCHRVQRIGGAMGGFRYGIDIKQALIAHEAHHTADTAA